PGVTRTELGERNAVGRAALRGISVAELQAEQERDPDRPRQHPRRHRRDGGLPRLARRPQHHRPVLQRRWRPGAELTNSAAPHPLPLPAWGEREGPAQREGEGQHKEKTMPESFDYIVA